MPLDVMQPAGFALPEFLKRAIVWPRPGDGSFVSMHVAWLRDGKRTYPGQPCMNEAEVGRYLGRNAGKYDVYVCMSTQTRRKANKPDRTDRSADFAGLIRSIYLDVDVKPGDPKAYRTERDLIDDVARVFTLIGLPPPTFVITTGSGGRHYHWVLDQPVQPDRWQKLADSLTNACEKHGLKFDSNVGVDCSRILRVPGTFNRKTGTPRPVLQDITSSLQDYNVLAMETILHPYYGQGRARTSAHKRVIERPPAFVGAVLDPAFQRSAATPVIGDQHRPTIEALATGCPWIAQTLASGGNGQREPLWKEAMNVACHVQDGERVAHRLSSGDPRYVPADTDAKYATQKAANLGWPSCNAVARAGSAECRTCPHLQVQNASLFHFMRAPAIPGNKPQPAALPTSAFTGGLVTAGFAIAPSSVVLGINGLPSGYLYDSACRVARKGQDGEPPKLICHNTFHGGRLVEHGYSDLRLRFDTDVGFKRVEIEVPLLVLADNRALFHCLAGQQMAINPDLNQVRRFMTSWIETLQKDPANLSVALPTFGWSGNGFIYDSTLFSPAGETAVLANDREESEKYRLGGERAPWDAAVAMLLARRNTGLNVILASALAGPLVPFTAEDGLWLHALSPPGGNKTTANRIAVAFWGAKTTKLGKNDTIMSVQKKMETLRNITVFQDDVRVDAENVADITQFAMMVTSGQGRARLTQDAKQRPIGYWSTFYSSNGNVSVREAFAEFSRRTAAAHTRVFEIVVPPVGRLGELEMGSAMQLINKVDDNYGHAGRVYAAYLGQHRDDVEAMVTKTVNAISQAYGCTSDERFWVCAMAVLLLSAAFARHLGLIPFSDQDMVAMREYLGNALQANRQEMAKVGAEATAASVADHVTEYLAESLGEHGVIIAGPGMPTPFTPSRHPVKIMIELNKLTGTVWFNQDHFAAWLRKRRLSAQAVVAQMMVLGATITNRKLCDGTIMKMPSSRQIGIATGNTHFPGLPI